MHAGKTSEFTKRSSYTFDHIDKLVKPGKLVVLPLVSEYIFPPQECRAN